MKLYTCEQRSEEWYSLRCGVPTASNFDKIITTKGTSSKQREKYLYKLVGERITGKPEETYQNGAMLRGIEMEEEARQFYSFGCEEEVKTVGFCMTDDKRVGASPDSLVGGNGSLEIKNPIMATHIGYLLNNKMPSDYIQQVQGQIYVAEREWCDFLSYYPGIKPLLIRVWRDDAFLKLLADELERFCDELDTLTEKIR